MSDRKDTYFRQKITEAELDAAFDGLESADRDVVIDANAEGVWFGLAVTERALGQNQSVDVAAGSAYDQLGQRMNLPAFQNVDISIDNVSASTQVGVSGSERLVGIYLKFDRILSDPRVDGNTVTVFFDRKESFKFIVRQGPEQVAPATSFPALQSDEILLADVRRTFNDNTIATANVETTRRQNSWIQTIGETVGIAASEVAFTPGATWATINTLASTTSQAAINEVVSDLASSTAGVNNSGAYNVGINVTETWASGDGITSLSLGAAIEEILADLKLVSPTSGAKRIGFQASQSQWANAANALAAGDIQAAVDEIVTDLASQGVTPGSALVGGNAYAGATIALVDGSIESQLKTIADNAVSLTSLNAWTNQQSYSHAVDTTPVIEVTDGATLNNLKLIAQYNVDGTIKIRQYVHNDASSEAIWTINASWNGTAYASDDTGENASLLFLGSVNWGFKHKAATAATWTTWDNENTIAAGDDFTGTAQADGRGAIAATEGSIGIADSALACFCPFTHIFPATPSSIGAITTGGFNSGGVTNEIAGTRDKQGTVLENDTTTADAYVTFAFTVS